MLFKEIQINEDDSKTDVIKTVDAVLKEQNFTVADRDLLRPWGSFWLINETQVPQFLETFFPGLLRADEVEGHKLSPKILLVEPNKRLSWQVHHRRAEHWKVINGPVGAYLSETDYQNKPLQIFHPGELVSLARQMRHRLVGLDSWGLMAEIWQHTDPENPSDEDDIIRLQDDFGR